MIRCLQRVGVAHDVARDDPILKPRRNEYVVEADVRLRYWHRHAGIIGMLQPERVDVAGIEHRLDRAPLDAAAAQPHERPKTERQARDVEHRAGGEGVEVTSERVETLLM